MTSDPRDPGDPDNDAAHLPIETEIDLHPFAPRDIPSVVEEYIREAHRAGFREVRVVHGRGRGVQRGTVQRVLDRLDEVREFWDDPGSSLGATIVVLEHSERIGDE